MNDDDLTRQAEAMARGAELLDMLAEAFNRRADVALGYRSWAAYCRAEIPRLPWPVAVRRLAVARLLARGMSRRAAGEALGVAESTVRRDLGALRDDEED